MGYELCGTAFLRAHNPLKSFQPFCIVIALLEISTKKIIQKKGEGNLYMNIDIYGRITDSCENWKEWTMDGSRGMVKQIMRYLSLWKAHYLKNINDPLWGANPFPWRQLSNSSGGMIQITPDL